MSGWAHLCQIDDLFYLRDYGLAVGTGFKAKDRFVSSEHPILIRKPNGDAFEALCLFNLTHFRITDPNRLEESWQIVPLIQGITEEDIPLGSELLVHPDLAEKLIPIR